MSVIHEQSILLESCRPEIDIQYLETILKSSIENTPLKQILRDYDKQNPESLRQTQLIIKEQNLKQTPNNQTPIKTRLFEESM